MNYEYYTFDSLKKSIFHLFTLFSKGIQTKVDEIQTEDIPMAWRRAFMVLTSKLPAAYLTIFKKNKK